MKVCKQCGRELDDACFRKTKSRSKGIYNTTQGSSTLCRNCESLNSRASQLLQKRDSGAAYNEESLKLLKQHYRRLQEAGRPIVSAAARRLLDDDSMQERQESNPLLRDAALLEHIAKLRKRSYASFDEADEVHRKLVDTLKQAGLYEEANNLIDDWFEEL